MAHEEHDVEAPAVTIRQGIARRVTAQDVAIRQGGALQITGGTVRLSQDCFSADSGMRKQFTVDSSQLKVQNVIVTWLRITHTI